MTLHYLLNQAPADATSVFPTIIAELIARGWVLRGSGNGQSSFDTTGVTNWFTTAAMAAATLAPMHTPWCVIEFPGQGGGTTRQLCFSLKNDGAGQTGRAWRIKYSPKLGFHDGPRTNGVVNGSISAILCPSSADEKLLIQTPATNDDTVISSGETVLDSNNNYIWNMVSDDASAAFWFVAHQKTGQRVCAALMVDPVVDYDPRDLDPYVFYMTNLGGNLTPFIFSADSNLSSDRSATGIGPQAVYGQGILATSKLAPALATGVWCYSTVLAARQLVIPRNIGTNPITGNEDVYPVRYYGQVQGQSSTTRFSSTYKGISTLMKWISTRRSNLSLNSTKTKILFEDVWLDWDGSTVPRQN